MKKRIGDYIFEMKNKRFTEMDLHQYLEMREAGMSDMEMAFELGVSKKVIEGINQELKDTY